MIDVSPAHLQTIQEILKRHAPGCEVRAFGSRFTWTAKDYSDLDLAIVGAGKRTLKEMAALREAFAESDLPYRVDVLDWRAISPEFQQVIEQGYEIIQKRGLAMSSDEWQPFKFGNIARLVKQQYLPNEEELVYVGLEHIEQQTLRLSGVGKSNETISQKFRFSGGDILFGKLRPYFRKVYRPKFNGVCSTDIWVVRAREGFDQGFLFYLMANQVFVDEANSGSSGTRMPRADWGHMEETIWDIPPLPTQRRIADILSTLDDKIELNRQTNATLEAIAQAIFKKWFVDNEEVENWDIQPLPEIIEINPLRRLSKNETTFYLDMANMPSEGHRAIEWRERPYKSGTRFINGDTLLARITPCLENGKTAFVDFLQDEKVGWGSTEFIILRPKPPLPPEYGYYLARTEELRSHAIINMIGTSGRQRTPSTCFESFLISVPPTNLAVQFGLIARTIMAMIKSNDEESRTLASIRDTLLPKLMSGEMEV